MERGLAWLPLLALFIGLAYAGWNEYRKVEAYRLWAAEFEQAKYDIRAVLGRKGKQLVWGQPTRQGPVHLQTLTLEPTTQFALQLDGQTYSCEADPLPTGRAIGFASAPRAIALRITLTDGHSYDIPFTEAKLAQGWAHSLQRYCHDLSLSEGD